MRELQEGRYSNNVMYHKRVKKKTTLFAIRGSLVLYEKYMIGKEAR